ncbi:hypothetical protein MPER_10228 [Moniliophthora perniciosa FA553]|nr:hypothetical protein MPER_10228 [Moniliophthora perniciosa FA553]
MNLVKFIEHLVYKQHLEAKILEIKIEHLMNAVDTVIIPTDPRPKKTGRKVKTPTEAGSSTGESVVIKPRAFKKKDLATKKQYSWNIPDLISPKWLCCQEWQENPDNYGKKMEAFEVYWNDLVQDNKKELGKWQKLSSKHNTENTHSSRNMTT